MQRGLRRPALRSHLLGTEGGALRQAVRRTNAALQLPLTLAGNLVETVAMPPVLSIAAGLLASLLLAACASGPAENSVVNAAVHVLTPADVSRLKPLQLQKLKEAGVTREDVSAGRLVRVGCALMSDGTWGSLAVLPRGLAVADRDVVQVRVKDAGDNDYDGVNEVLGPVTPRLTSGQPAYRFIPDWRERGLRRNIERIELPPEIRHRYFVVHSSYVVKCRP